MWSRTPEGTGRSRLYSRQALKWCPSKAGNLKIKILVNLGLTAYQVLQIDSAVTHYQDALRICNQEGLPCLTLRNNISLLFDDLGDQVRSVDFLLPVVIYIENTYPDLQIDPDVDFFSIVPIVYSNLVELNLGLGQIEEAGKFARSCLKVVQKNDYDTRYQILALMRMGAYYSRIGQHDQAKEFFGRMIGLVKKLPDGGADDALVVESVSGYATEVLTQHWDDHYGYALASIRLIKDVNPREADTFYHNKGMLLLELNELDSAKHFLSLASEHRTILKREANLGVDNIKSSKLSLYPGKEDLDVNWNINPYLIGGLLVVALALMGAVTRYFTKGDFIKPTKKNDM